MLVTQASIFCKKKDHLPLSTIFPNKFFPLKKFLVEQFHLWFLNWYWHSWIAWLAPLAIADSNPGFSRTKRLCFLLKVLWTDESINATPGDIGDRLFGSPALAIPLEWSWKEIRLTTQKYFFYYNVCNNCKSSNFKKAQLSLRIAFFL